MALPPEARGGRPQPKRARRRKAARKVARVAPQAAAYVSLGHAVEHAANQQRHQRTHAFSPRPTVPRVVTRPSPQVKRVTHELGIQSRSAQASRRTAAARRSTPRGTPGRALLERERHQQIAQTRTERKAARNPAVRDVLTNKRAGAAFDAVRPQLLNQVSRELDRQIRQRDDNRPISAMGVNLPLRVGDIKAAVGNTVRLASLAVPGTNWHTTDSIGITKNAATDIVDISTNAIPSIIHTIGTAGAGVNALRKGDLAEAEKQGKKLADETLGPYVQIAKHPIKSFVEHPVYTALALSGVKGGIGRGVGGVMRHLPSETTRRLASTHAPLRTTVVPGTGMRIEGTYSPDVLTKIGQTAKDRYIRPPQPIMKGNKQAGYVNHFIGREEDVRRVRRAMVERQSWNDLRDKSEDFILSGRRNKPSAATSAIAQGIGQTRAALEEYRAQVKAAHDRETSTTKRNQQKANLKAIDKAIKHFDEPGQRKAAARFIQTNQTLQRELQKRGLAPGDDLARYVPFAVQHMGARRLTKEEVAAQVRLLRDEKRGAGKVDREALDTRIAEVERSVGTLVDQDGVPIPKEAIQREMADAGFLDPGFVTHAPGALGARAYYAAMKEPRGVSNEMRSGEAVRQGLLDLNPQAMVETNVKAQGLIDAFDGFKRFVHHFGRQENGKLWAGSYKDARRRADELHDKTGTTWVPVRALPLAARKDVANALFESSTVEGGHASVKAALDEAFGALDGQPADTKGAWVVVPERVANEYRGHLQKTVHPAIAALNSAFRGTVLGTNLNWLTGNGVEAALRALVAGAGPGSYRLGKEALKQVERRDQDAGLQARMATVAGGHYSLAYRNNVHTPVEKFTGDRIAAVARAAAALRRAPGPKQIADFWGQYSQFVFHTLNGQIETQFQTAMLGRALKKDPLFTKRLLYWNDKAVSEAADMLTNTPAQIRLGKEIERMYGKYGNWSPNMRAAIAGYTPFLAWSINAIRFLFSVLPRDHPVLTSLIANVHQAQEDWRKSYGAYTTPFKVDPNGPPQWLVRGAVPAGKGFYPASRNTPFGIGATEGGILASLGSAILPQLSGVIHASQGEDWKGDSLGGFGKTSPDALNALAMATSFIESTVPLAGQAATVAGVRLPNQAPTKSDPGSLPERFARAGHAPWTIRESHPRRSSGGSSRRSTGVTFGSSPSTGVTFGPSTSTGVRFGG